MVAPFRQHLTVTGALWRSSLFFLGDGGDGGGYLVEWIVIGQSPFVLGFNLVN